MLITEIPKKSLKNIILAASPAAQNIQMPHLQLFMGRLMRQSIISPTILRRIVEAVEISVCSELNTFPNLTISPTTIVFVSPAGSAFMRILFMNFPLMRSLFGIWERKNAGIPMVNILMSEMCAGFSGQLMPKSKGSKGQLEMPT